MSREYTPISSILSQNVEHGSDWRNMLSVPKKSNIKERKEIETKTVVGALINDLINSKEPDLSGVSREHIGLFNQLKLGIGGRLTNVIAAPVNLTSDSLGISGTVQCLADFDNKLSIVTILPVPPKTVEEVHSYATACSLICFEQYDTLIDYSAVIYPNTTFMMPLVSIESTEKYFDYVTECISAHQGKKK